MVLRFLKYFSGDKVLLFNSLLILTLTGIIYSPWLSQEIAGGDWVYQHVEMHADFSITRPFWTGIDGFPAGGVNPNFAFYWYTNFVIGIFVNVLGLPWNFIYKFFYFYLYLALALFSIHKLLKSIFPKPSRAMSLLAGFIYTTNTYILLVVSGGQMGIALSYAVAPLVLSRFIQVVYAIPQKRILYQSVLLGVCIALQIFFDMRLAYLTVIAGIFVIFCYWFVAKVRLVPMIKYMGLSGIIAIGIHAFWTIPFILFGLLQVPADLTTKESLEFFSFAKFENALGLLHPNWPENIFGKIYFMRWEFLLFPSVIFGTLLCVMPVSGKNKSGNIISYIFLLLAIVGIFLSKGLQEPWGIINTWIYESVPGMNLFRDPTKFYLYIAIPYSVLMPITLERISAWLTLKFAKHPYMKSAVLFLFLLYWSLLLMPVWKKELGGTFRTIEVPIFYQDLARKLHNEQDFFRTLWIPTESRYRYQSELHPLIHSRTLFNATNDNDHIEKLLNPTSKEKVEQLSIKYIILPNDTDHEIFLTDRLYDETVRQKYKKALDSIPWLSKILDDPLDIYENMNVKDHIWIEGEQDFAWQRISSSNYRIVVNIPEDKTLFFSETYHPGWQIVIGDLHIIPTKSQYQTMSFVIPKGQYEGNLQFRPQQFAIYGYLISFITLIGSVYIVISANR